MADLIKKPDLKTLMAWQWADFEPAYAQLQNTVLNTANIEQWLLNWSEVFDLADELYNRLFAATSIDTADTSSSALFDVFMKETFPQWRTAEQALKEKLLASGLSVPGFEIALRNMRADADLFREANIPLQVQEELLGQEHDKVLGAQAVDWHGQERTVYQMQAELRATDRATRQEAWEKLSQRQLADRQTINSQWQDFFALRKQIAKNAGKSDFRAFRWQLLNRFDYSPADCRAFHDAIEAAVVPAVERLMDRRRKKLGLESLRYFDLFVDLSGQAPLKPFKDVKDLTARASAVFHQVDPDLGAWFDIMDKEGLLDLGNRKNKANGGYCIAFSHSKRPFIFANAVGIHDDVQTLMHEGGHAFHAFESFHLPYYQQRSESNVPIEFAEVASMAMEFLSAPYFEEKFGGYYSPAEAARARADTLEASLCFWPYMAIVDAFQHWAYENPEAGSDPHRCDAKWAELGKRFRPYIDWRGYEDVMMTGWQRKDHIHNLPFYYVEYGLALLGATQVWMNALKDQKQAVAQYRAALRLGGTRSLPELYQAAGAKLAFDARTLQASVNLLENTIYELESTY